MRGLADFYISFLYKRKATKIGNLIGFYIVICYFMVYGLYYANILEIWFAGRITDYSDYIFYYAISCIFYFYELLFKGISLYGTYFPSLATMRLESGLIINEQMRLMYGSVYKHEDNTFLQRSFPKPHFVLLTYIFYIFLYAYNFNNKLFVKKKHMYFFLSLLHLQIILSIFNCSTVFIFFGEYQLNVFFLYYIIYIKIVQIFYLLIL
jgi:hypothetical protein